MKLYAHQERLIKSNPYSKLLCWDTGTGKSIASIEWAKILPDSTTLIVVPKALREKWNRDIKDYPRWAVMSKEEFRKQWKSLPTYDNLIVDEAHYFSGMTSLMSKALYGYIKAHKPRRLLLTATPYMSTPWNIFTLARHLGHDWHYLDFKQKFFVDRYIGRRVVPQVREGIQDEIAELVARIGDVVRLDECADVPEQVFETEMFKLTEGQNKAKEKVTDINPIVRYTKYHEIANGFLKGDEYAPDEYYEADKMDRVLELCKENKKVAIVCRYNAQIEGISLALKCDSIIKSKPVYIIQGATKNKDEVVRAIEADEECVVIINASCSEGYELPSVGVIVFASLSFSYKDYKQMLGRFLRINKLKKNVYIHLVTAESIDEEVFKCVMKKQDFDIEIYAREHDYQTPTNKKGADEEVGL